MKKFKHRRKLLNKTISSEILRRAPSLVGLLHSVHYKEKGEPRKTKGISRREALRLHYRKRKGKRQGQLGDPNSQRAAYGIPANQAVTMANNTGMVWGKQKKSRFRCCKEVTFWKALERTAISRRTFSNSILSTTSIPT